MEISLFIWASLYLLVCRIRHYFCPEIMPSVAENGVVAPLPTKSLVLGTSQEKLGLKVWNSLANTLPAPANKDVEFWWGITGYHLAVMIDQAGYSIERQYEVLLFHYQWIVSIFICNDSPCARNSADQLQGPSIGSSTPSRWQSSVQVPHRV